MAAKPEFEKLMVLPGGEVVVTGPAPEEDPLICVMWHIDQGGKVLGGVTKPENHGGKIELRATAGRDNYWDLNKTATVVGVEVRVDRKSGKPLVDSYTWTRELPFTDLR